MFRTLDPVMVGPFVQHEFGAPTASVALWQKSVVSKMRTGEQLEIISRILEETARGIPDRWLKCLEAYQGSV